MENNISKMFHALLLQNEREAYEVVVEDGKLVYKQSGMLLNTTEGSKWIFVLSTSRVLYVGKKKKGVFQHSSFLSGGATTAAGRLVVQDGILEVYFTNHANTYVHHFLLFHFIDFSHILLCRQFGHTAVTIFLQKIISRNLSISLRNTM